LFLLLVFYIGGTGRQMKFCNAPRKRVFHLTIVLFSPKYPTATQNSTWCSFYKKIMVKFTKYIQSTTTNTICFAMNKYKPYSRSLKHRGRSFWETERKKAVWSWLNISWHTNKNILK